MIYQKTETGHTAFKTRSSELSSRQRSAFLLFDGHRTFDEVLKATAGLGIAGADIDDMVGKGFLAAAAAQPPGRLLPPPPGTGPLVKEDATNPPPIDAATESARYQAAYPIATRITAQLGLRGFRLNLAVEAAAGYKDLLALLPKITQSVGEKTAEELKRALLR